MLMDAVSEIVSTGDTVSLDPRLCDEDFSSLSLQLAVRADIDFDNELMSVGDAVIDTSSSVPDRENEVDVENDFEAEIVVETEGVGCAVIEFVEARVRDTLCSSDRDDDEVAGIGAVTVVPVAVMDSSSVDDELIDKLHEIPPPFDDVFVRVKESSTLSESLRDGSHE